MQLHQCHQAVHLGLPCRQLRHGTAQAQGLVAQRWPHPILARGGRVALVEHEVDHVEHRGEAQVELRAARHLERHVRLRQRPLGADDALGDGRLGDEKRARDLVGGEPAEQAQRQGDARLGGQHRMAGREDQPQQVVADVVIQGRHEVCRGLGAAGFQVPRELLVFPDQAGAPTHLVDGAVLRRCHQPGAGVSREAPRSATARAPPPARRGPGLRPGRGRAPCASSRR